MLTSADGGHHTIETLPGAYQEYYKGITARLRDGTPLPVDPADARNGLIVIEAAQRSAAEQRTVMFA